jgi:hypothetical protein
VGFCGAGAGDAGAGWYSVAGKPQSYGLLEDTRESRKRRLLQVSSGAKENVTRLNVCRYFPVFDTAESVNCRNAGQRCALARARNAGTQIPVG